MKKKLHWYLMSFIEPNPGGGFKIASATSGFTNQKITNQRIKAAKEAAEMIDANTLAVSYLGYMTEDELSA